MPRPKSLNVQKGRAGMTQPKDVAAANDAEVNRSVDEWRAMQGLPPVDRSKKARHDGDQ